VAPPSVVHALVETRLATGSIVFVVAVAIRLWLRTATQVGDLHGLDVDRVVLAHQGKRCLVVKVAPLPADVLMLLGALVHRLGASVTALRAAGDALLGFVELLLGCAVVPRVLGGVPLRQ